MLVGACDDDDNDCSWLGWEGAGADVDGVGFQDEGGSRSEILDISGL